ncbi:amiloride-sensitive sodium channel subunit alpha-like [Limulus polyphemus]|uniref:Amiloride-sensitive sodium channel subunit alpha-like n=1 Tax=Limulus polyphemus TaxID=6850 RepID=A0ABM1SHM6_LIMPO|nr:amiloride-sensitive sodium channel subunit alpha-like [Limulus polyphemus]
MESADEAIPSVKVSAKISEISNTDLVNCTSSSIRKGIWDIFKNMFGQSSFSGLSQLAKSPTNSRRCAWVVVFFICIGLCTYHSIRFVTSYMEYPVVVSLDVENNKKLEFPAITVCNLNGNFTISNSFLYGNCYTFNAAWSSTSTPKTTTSVGAISGLTVELNLQRNDYLEKITPKLGARVVIHSPFAAPQPENEGIDISPGLVTSVTISKVTTERLPAPYKDKCRNYEEQSVL